MSYEEFINNTYPNDIFDIIKCREDGSCCYNSFLISLKKTNPQKIKKNLNSKVIQSKAVKWIIENKDKKIDLFCLTMKEIVLNNHQIENLIQFPFRVQIYMFNDSVLIPAHDFV